MPNGFGSIIAGPGIGGGASEIAAVSVGVYANTSQLALGFNEVKREAAQAATGIGAEGAVAGKAYSESLTSTLVTQGRHLRHGVHQFMRAITSTMLVGEVAVGAFEIGQKFGELLFGGAEESIDHLKKQVDGLTDYAQKKLGDKFSEFGKNRQRGGGPELILIDVEAEQKRLQEVTDKLRLFRELQAADAKSIEAARNRIFTDKNDRFVNDQQVGRLRDQEEERAKDINALEQERIGILAKLQGLKQAAADSAERELKATREKEASERRISAQREVAANRTASDIGRIRQLMEIGQRQRYGPAPGFGVQKGGWSR